MALNPRSEILLQSLEDEERAVLSGRVPLDPTLIADAYDNDDFWTRCSHDGSPNHQCVKEVKNPIQDRRGPPCQPRIGVRMPLPSRKRTWLQMGDSKSDPCAPTTTLKDLARESCFPAVVVAPNVVFPVPNIARRVSGCDQDTAPSRDVGQAREEGSICQQALDQTLMLNQCPDPTVPVAFSLIGETAQSPTIAPPVPEPPRSACQFFVRHKLQRLRQKGCVITKDSLHIPLSIEMNDFHQWKLARSVESIGWNIDPSTGRVEQHATDTAMMPQESSERLEQSTSLGRQHRRPRSDTVAGLVQYLTEGWDALPTTAKTVFREIAAQDSQRYRREIVERVCAGTLPTSWIHEMTNTE